MEPTPPLKPPKPAQSPADANATMDSFDPASAMTQLPSNQTAPTAIAGRQDATAATVVAGNQGTAATVVTDQATTPTAITVGPANALDALVGRSLGGCRIESLLGRGGMGAVFKAHQESLSRSVALKVMLPGRDADPQFASRFQREARVVASLNHPHVVQVYDTGRAEDGMLYLVMEFVDGRSLAQVIRDQGPLPIPVVLALIREAAEGLAAAHAKALVHRDIKPDNLMISADARVKVMDFGLARPTEGGSGDSALTMSGMILGTPNYISPEAARGEPADIRADLYSLGVTLWQCVAGKLPFTGPTPVQVLVQHIESAPPDLAQAMPSCPRSVSALCQRLLAKRADERYATPADLVTAIIAIEQRLCGRSARLRWDGKVLVADAVLTAEPAATRSHAPAIVGTLVVVLALVAVAIGAGWYAMRDVAPPAGPTPAATDGPKVTEPSTEPVGTVAEPRVSPDVVVAQAASPADLEPATPTTPKSPEPVPVPPVVEGAVTAPVVPSEPPPVALIPAPVSPTETASVAPTLPAEPPPVATNTVAETPVEAAPEMAPVAPTLPAEPPPAATVAVPVPVAAPSAPALVPIATVPPAAPVRPASLFVSSIPSGATVEVNGEVKGTTPCTIPGLPAGEHRLRVHGHGADERTVVVLPGGRMTRISTPLPEPARLELLNLPAQARVTVDGKPYAPSMAVLTGTITVQVISAGGARAFQVDTVVGHNVFGYSE